MRDPNHTVGVAESGASASPSTGTAQRRTTGDRQPGTGNPRAQGGFTLLELIIVVAVIGILATIAMPRMIDTPKRAREAALKTDLRTMRDTIDQYYADKGYYPPSLEALVDEGYLRAIPPDPVTHSTETWIPVYEEIDYESEPAETDLPEDGQPGIWDVKSGAEGTTLDGTPYGEL
jgi:general secretion pathway protein G